MAASPLTPRPCSQRDVRQPAVSGHLVQPRPASQPSSVRVARSITNRDSDGGRAREGHLLRSVGGDVARGGSTYSTPRSMYESSLRREGHWDLPEMKGVDQVLKSLGSDIATQSIKYNGSTEANLRSARFHVRLPQGPQHDKYSASRGSRPVSPETPPTPSTSASSRSGLEGPCVHAPLLPSMSARPSPGFQRDALQQSIKFNKTTLQRWFKAIDRDGSGAITQRELIVALREKRDLLSILSGVRAGPQHASQGKEHALHVRGFVPPGSVGDKAVATREEIYRIKGILKEVDTDNSGTMEWPEFVDFFRRAGCLLEYSDGHRNRTSLCQEAELEQARQLEESPTERRTAFIHNIPSSNNEPNNMTD